jgi:Ser/Thr protein kinase RdoA (MazF antagonist)
MSRRVQPGFDVAGLLGEYDIGAVLGTDRLPGGTDSVLRVRTDRGTYVLKPTARPADVELQARVAEYLNGRGVRQALIVPTQTGAMVSRDGAFVQEFLPGSLALQPATTQVAATMRHIGAYHRELANFPGPCEPEDSVWQRVADPSYLVTELPGLLARYDLADQVTLAGLGALGRHRRRLENLPRQLVHGDIGPDNVLMAGEEVVSIIDFTPYWESTLFAGCTALYWYHVYGRAAVDPAGLRASIEALGQVRARTTEEVALWPAGLLREALRRLATPLVLAAESGAAPGPSLGPRLAALLATVDAIGALDAPEQRR